ncbi:hypothetical protein F5Y06DRAFT_257640 [Hypoxylon sp. FL0890]|nr:hypothetical protein F5Y06DRAFT_257640 [Hypoxylon sp. FL0890]
MALVAYPIRNRVELTGQKKGVKQFQNCKKVGHREFDTSNHDCHIILLKAYRCLCFFCNFILLSVLCRVMSCKAAMCLFVRHIGSNTHCSICLLLVKSWIICIFSPQPHVHAEILAGILADNKLARALKLIMVPFLVSSSTYLTDFTCKKSRQIRY